MTDAPILASAAIAFAVTVVLMFALRPVAASFGLVDKPGGRKLHDGEVPIIGGVAMFFGMFAGLMLLPASVYQLTPLFAACSLLLVLGVIDDRFHVHAPVRMTGQIAAVLIMVYGAGLALPAIGDPFGTGEIGMGRFTLIFTMLVTLTMINAYNLIDGADGLAGSLALVALVAVGAVAGVDRVAGVAAVTIAAAIVGFLLFNFPTPWNRQVRSFMGDAGSTLLGFTIVWVTLGVSTGADRLISPVHCLWFASIPIYDTLTCFVRRALNRKSPFAPGRDHFHHTLLRGGFGVRQTLAILTGLQALYAVIAVVAHSAAVPDVAMFAAWSVLGVSQWWVVRKMAASKRFITRQRTRPQSR